MAKYNTLSRNKSFGTILLRFCRVRFRAPAFCTKLNRTPTTVLGEKYDAG